MGTCALDRYGSPPVWRKVPDLRLVGHRAPRMPQGFENEGDVRREMRIVDGVLIREFGADLGLHRSR
jgi:hypothetical protein